MKTVRKLTTLLLVLAMIFSVSVSASATPASTATLQINYYGEALLNPSPVTFTVTSGMTAKDALELYADEIDLVWALSAAGSGYDYAVDTIFGIGMEPIGSDSGITAQFWSTTYPGYGIEYTETVDGETVYHFIYAGEEWRFFVNGIMPEECWQIGSRLMQEQFLNRYTLQAGDVLSVEYMQIVHRWTGTTNFLQST